MPDLWYYGRNEQRHGPVPLETLKQMVSSGYVDMTDLVWSPGMADWVPASEVDGLFSATATMVVPLPPPSPEATSPPPPPPATEACMAGDRWHYERQGERQSPVSFAELQRIVASGRIHPDNLVWKTGMPEWLPAVQVEGLFSLPASPPPPPLESPSPPPSPPEAEAPVGEEHWHYERQGERCGPVSFRELQSLAASGQIQPDNLTWKRGMAEWTPAGQIGDLFPARPEFRAQPAVHSADLWYYGDGEQRHGPVSIDELRRLASSGQLRPDDLVWIRGMTQWTAASDVEGLFAAGDVAACESGLPVALAFVMPATSAPVPSVRERAIDIPDPATATVGQQRRWYYSHAGEQSKAVSWQELVQLAASGRLQKDDRVRDTELMTWQPASSIPGLFEQAAVLSPTSWKSGFRSARDAAAPHMSRIAAATRTNWERFRKFIHRQHLGTRIRLLIAATVGGVAWCYNAARPHVVRAWSKRPSKQEVRDWSVARAQKASDAWKRTAPQRSRLSQQASVGLNEARQGLAWCRNSLRDFLAWSWRKAPSQEDCKRWLASGSRKASSLSSRTASWLRWSAAWAASPFVRAWRGIAGFWRKLREFGAWCVHPLRSHKSSPKPMSQVAPSPPEPADSAVLLPPNMPKPESTVAPSPMCEGELLVSVPPVPPLEPKPLPPAVAAAAPKRKPLPPDVAAAAPKPKPPNPEPRPASPPTGSEEQT